jgi:hypothetical protein
MNITRETTFTCYDWPPAEGGPQVSVNPVPGSAGRHAVVEIGRDVVLELAGPLRLRALAALLIAGAAELERAAEGGPQG